MATTRTVLASNAWTDLGAAPPPPIYKAGKSCRTIRLKAASLP